MKRGMKFYNLQLHGAGACAVCINIVLSMCVAHVTSWVLNFASMDKQQSLLAVINHLSAFKSEQVSRLSSLDWWTSTRVCTMLHMRL